MGFDFDKHSNSASASTTNRTAPEGDYKYHPRLYWTTGNVVEFDIGGFQYLNSKYGTSLVLYMDDAEVIHGGLYERDGDTGDNRKLKLFGFDSLGFDLDAEDVTADDMPLKKVQEGFGKKFVYNRLGIRYQYDDGSVGEADADALNLGTVRMFFDVNYNEETGEGGPQAASKRAVKLLAEDGTAALGDLDSIHDWVDEDVSVASDLHGKRVRMWMFPEVVTDEAGNVRTDANGDAMTYNRLEIEDVETGEALRVRNVATDTTAPTPEEAQAVVDDEEDEEPVLDASEIDAVPAAPDGGYSDALDSVLDWCASNLDSDRDKQGLAAAVKSGKIGSDEVDGREAELVEEIRQRRADAPAPTN